MAIESRGGGRPSAPLNFLSAKPFGSAKEKVAENSALLDSGSTHSISGIRNDFAEIEREPSITVAGIDGFRKPSQGPEGCAGTFRENVLGLTQGIYYKNLGSRRIVSVLDLVENGWETIFGNGKPKLRLGPTTVFGEWMGRQPLIKMFREPKNPRATLGGLNMEGSKCHEVSVFKSDASRENNLVVNTNRPAQHVSDPGWAISPHDVFASASRKDESTAEPCSEFHPLTVVLSCGAHEMKAGKVSKKESGPSFSLDLHRKLAHLSIPGLKVSLECPECAVSKGKHSTHKGIRDKKYWPAAPFSLIAVDFMGPIDPPAVGKETQILVAICDATAFVFVDPVCSKTDIYDAIPRIIEGIRTRDARFLDEKIVRAIRTDNEKVVRERPFQDALKKVQVEGIHSAPYSPQMNGVVERFMQTLSGSIRSNLVDVDDRLWAYASRYVGYIWNRIPRTYARFPQGNGKTPYEIRNLLRDGLLHTLTTTRPTENKKGRKETCPLENTPLSAKETPNVDFPLSSFDQAEPKCESENLTQLPQICESKRLKRFGTLSYVQIEDRKKLRKLDDRFEVCVFLGFSQMNSAWLFGTFVPDESRKDHWRWREYESKSAKFTNFLVSDIDSLKDKSTKGVVISPEALEELEALTEGSKYPDQETALVEENRENRAKLSKLETPVGGGVVKESTFENPENSVSEPPSSSESPRSSPHIAVDHQKVEAKGLPGTCNTEKPETSGTPREYSFRESGGKKTPIELDEVVKALRKRDREKTTFTGRDSKRARPNPGRGAILAVQSSVKHNIRDFEDSNIVAVYPPDLFAFDWKLSGRVKTSTCERNRNTNVSSKTEENCVCTVSSAAVKHDSRPHRRSCELKHDEGLNAISYRQDIAKSTTLALPKKVSPESNGKPAYEKNVGMNFPIVESRIGVTAALKCPDAESWKAAMSREYEKLVEAETWRDLTKEEISTQKDVIPLCVLLTRKRDGTFKARACVLGNLYNAENIELYAPTVSFTAQRLMLVEIAKNRDHVKVFDLDCAFLNAHLNECVYISIPPAWSKKGESRVKRLKKALYGLPQAPRAWQKVYEAFLKELSWTQCPLEPGIYRKASQVRENSFLKLSVYVDDNLIAGPDLQELQKEIDLILARFKGRAIPPVVDGSTHTYDLLGADWHYCREQGGRKLSMGTYIDKICDRFKIKGRKVKKPLPG